MNYWIFQAVMKQYPLPEKLRALPGDRWRVTRYVNEIRAGDIVYFWLGGTNAGIYGWGNVRSEKPEQTLNQNYRSEVSYVASYTEPILKTVILAEPELKDLHILRSPQGTNFRVTEDEARVLNKLIRGAQLPCPPDPP